MDNNYQLIYEAGRRGMPIEEFPDEQSQLVFEAGKRGMEINFDAPSEGAASVDERRQPNESETFTKSTMRPGFTDSVVRGKTLGFSDEVGAAGRVVGDYIGDLLGLPGESKSYRDHLQDKREEYNAYQEENPKAAMAGELVGGVMTGATTIGPLAAGGKTTLARIGRGAGAGGAEGSVAGAGYSDANPLEETGKFVGDVAVGGGVGTTLGGGLPAVGSSLRKGFNKVLELATERGVEKAALQKVVQAVARDDMTIEEAMKRVDDMGPSAALVDSGENAQGLLEAVASRPGNAAKMAKETLQDRADNQFGRIMSKFDDVMGDADKALAIPEESGAFQNALKVRVPLTDTLKRVMQRPAMRTAWARAQKLAAEKDQNIPPLNDVLKGEYKEAETTVMHWLKKGLDDVLEPKRDPVTGAVQQKFSKNQLHAVKETRRLFRDEVKRLNPEYAKQLQVAGEPLQINEAFEKGSKFLRLRNEGQVSQQIARMSEPEINSYKRGVLQAIEDSVSGRAEVGHDVSASILRHARKLRALFGDKADDIIQTLKNEREFAGTKNRVTGNSRTAYRQQAMQDLDGGIPTAATEAMTGNFGNALSQVGRGLVNKVVRPSEAVGQRAAEILLTTDKKAREAIMADLLRGETLQEAFRRQGMALTGGTTGGALSAR